MKKVFDWKSCIEQRFVKSVMIDVERIASLVGSAQDRERTADILPINNMTKETVVSLEYDVLRELLEAIALQQGYKIYNHECFTYFLRTVIKDERFAEEFDSLRTLRNAINYYGKRILLSDAQRAIADIKKLTSLTRKMLHQKLL